MVIIGYPGIGKSTLVRNHPGGKFIDLESSLFATIKGDKNWANVYCRLALALSRKGHDVFVSSHVAIQREMLEQITECDRVIVCYPSLSLKSVWLRRLRERYQYQDTNEIDKNKAALIHSIDFYNEDINTLHNSSFEECVIESMDYDLETLLYGDRFTKSEDVNKKGE